MKTNISRIIKNKDSLKSIENVVLELYEDSKGFIEYELKTSKDNDNKLVFMNVNHKSMLNKYLKFEHFYIILLVVIVICGLSLFSNSFIMVILSIIGLVYIPYRFISCSEVPFRLVFDGLNIYELNLVGKRIFKFSPTSIESSDSDKFENDFIFFSTSTNTKEKTSMMIKEGYSFEERDLFIKYYRKFNFTNSIKTRS
ncbi:hypothetical protein [Pontimicrobium sp. IMCC45349]|uniref:hypothetical protein n=1 Tax=Pontimicrobium sp. IMCC45349 TaxID=3391574 RepID=UPI00399FF7A4